MKKKLASTSLAVSLILNFVSPVSYANYKDTESHWAKDVISAFSEKNLVSGYTDDTFKPNKEITRAEFISILNKVLGYTDTKNITFKDVKISDWYYKDVQIAYAKGYIKGYTDNTFMPNKTITRAEACVIIASILGEKPTKQIEFADKNSVPSWAKDAISLLVEKNIISGYSNGNISANKKLTRAEAVVMLDKSEKSYTKLNSIVDNTKIKEETKKEDVKKEEREKQTSSSGSSSSNSSSDKKSEVFYGVAQVDNRDYPVIKNFIHPPFYNARIKVVLENDKIVSVSDNETIEKGGKNETPSNRNKKWWDMILSSDLFKKFEGKTLEEVKKMDMSSGAVDTIAGATESARAVQEAVINAIEKNTNKGKFLENNQTLTAKKEITADDIIVEFENTLPEDFKLELLSVIPTVYNSSEKGILGVYLSEDGKTLKVPIGLKAGHYFVNIIDKEKAYRSPDFETGHGTGRHYPYFVVKSTATLTLKDDVLSVSDNDLENVFKNIEHIKITQLDKNGSPVKIEKTDRRTGKTVLVDDITEIETVGHHGVGGTKPTVIFDETTGKIKPNAVSEGRVIKPYFVKDKTYKIEVETFGYGTVETIYIAKDTNAILYGSHNVDQVKYPLIDTAFIHPPFFDIRVKVEVDKDGKIVAVSDDETGKKSLMNGATPEFWKQKNAIYFDMLLKEKFFDKFVGKTLDEVKSMKTGTGEVDTLSGATSNAIAVQKAVINAIENRQSRKYLEDSQTLKANPMIINQGETTVKFQNTLPKDFDLKLIGVIGGVYNTTTDNMLGIQLSKDGTTLSNLPIDLKGGHYYVNIVDGSDTYRSPDFEIGRKHDNRHYPYFVIKNNTQLKYENDRLINEDLENIFKNIESIVVKEGEKETTIYTLGHHSTINDYAKQFFKKDGSVNEDAKYGKNGDMPVFESGKKYKITLDVWGYEDKLTFEYTAPTVNNPVVPTPIEKVKNVEEVIVPSMPYEAYSVKLKVVLENGIIKSVEDETVPANSSKIFWNMIKNAKALDKYVGKNKQEVDNMNVQKDGADVVSGATDSSVAIKEAIKKSFE